MYVGDETNFFISLLQKSAWALFPLSNIRAYISVACGYESLAGVLVSIVRAMDIWRGLSEEKTVE